MIKENECIIIITNRNRSKGIIDLYNIFAYTNKIDIGDRLMSNNIDHIDLVNNIALGLNLFLYPVNKNKSIILDDYFLDTLVSIMKEEYNELGQAIYFALEILPKEDPSYEYASIELNFIKYDFKPVNNGDTILQDQYILSEPIYIG